MTIGPSPTSQSGIIAVTIVARETRQNTPTTEDQFELPAGAVEL
jgi:hypothetical protein